MTSQKQNPVSETDEKYLEPIEQGFIGKFFYGVGVSIVRLFTRFEIRGQENIPEHAPFILAPNHETYVDGMLASMGLDRTNRKKFCSLAAKDLLESHGVFGKLIMHVGRGIPIDRDGASIHSLKTCIYQLQKGNILMIHPEGTRTADGKLGRIRDGSAFIAKHAEVPIVPVFLDGGFEIFSRHMKWPKFWAKPFRRKRLVMSYGKPLYPSDYKNTKALTRALTDWYEEAYRTKVVPRVYEGANLAYMQKIEADPSQKVADEN